MDAAVEALYTANHAMHALLSTLGLTPDAVLGHSTGEYSAMRAAGMLNEERYEARLRALSRTYEGATAGGRVPAPVKLLAIGAAREKVEQVCEAFGEHACVAMDNCLHQSVLVATHDAAANVESTLRQHGLLYEVLPFDRPYHTAAFEEYAQELRDFLVDLIARPPQVPVYSATSTRSYPTDLAAVHRLAYEHWIRPVEFRRTIENMYADGIRLFVEAGPRGNLTTFVDDILGGRSYAAIPSNVSRRSGITQLNHLVAQLAAHGVRLTLSALHAHRSSSLIELQPGSSPARADHPIGRVKIPTGAPELRLSADVAAHIRSRTRGFHSSQEVATIPDLSLGGSRAPEAGPPAEPDEGGAENDGAPGVTSAVAPSTETSVHPRDARAARSLPSVMAAYADTMERFLAVQADVMQLALGGTPESRQAASAVLSTAGTFVASADPLPLIDTVVALRPGEELVARCTLDLERCPLLRDHCIGRDVSTDDPELPAFPVVPFTLLMEIMAEAAVALRPGGTLTGMRDVRVHRALGVDRGAVVIDVQARCLDGDRVTVQLREADPTVVAPIAEGVMVLASGYPEAPVAEALDLPDAAPYKWPDDRLYSEAMFHGPAFRGVLSMDRVGKTGADATLVVLERTGRLSDGRASMVTDPVLLDLPGQVVGFWASHFFEQGFFVLPFRMEGLTLYGPPPTAGERLTCRARIALVGEQQVRSTLDVVRADGRLWARLEGWDDRRFQLPALPGEMLLRPGAVMLSQSWPVGMNGPGPRASRFVLRRLGTEAFPPGWLTAHGGLWARVLAGTVLGRQERAQWHALAGGERRRIEWLLGRIAAKDAVREYVRRDFGLSLCPADVELLPEDSGRPVVSGRWTARVPRIPLVSISHVDGVAVAMAGHDDGTLGLGIDLERLGRMGRTTERVAFSAPEMQMLEGLESDQREAWSLRLWCAKEAAAKATGHGLAGGPHAFAVQRFDRQSGDVWITCQSPGRAVVQVASATAQDGDWVVATCAAVATENVRT